MKTPGNQVAPFLDLKVTSWVPVFREPAVGMVISSVKVDLVAARWQDLMNQVGGLSPTQMIECYIGCPSSIQKIE